MTKAKDAELSKPALRAWYKEAIGYDPFADDSTITVEEVARIRREYQEVVAAANTEKDA